MGKFEQSAFPKMEVKQTKNSYGDVTGYVCESTGGLTKREYYALTLMQAIISNADRHSQEGDCQTWNYEHLSKIAISEADHLLTELRAAGEKI